MTTTSLTAPATRKPLRYATWLNHVGHGLGTLRIKLVYPSGREEVDLYSVAPIDGDGLPAFHLERIDPVDSSDSEPAGYDVCLGGSGWAPSCECKGWLKWGRCKHHSCLEALAARDQL